MDECRICRSKSVVEMLDFGMHPISNRYVVDPTEEEYLHPIVIGQCNVCGLVQIINPVLAGELLPPYEWIVYNEPEGHLDKLADIISTLPGITEDAIICGISYKDDSTLERLGRRGFNQIWRIDPVRDLRITLARAGIETIQDRLCPDMARTLREKYGRSDVVIVRQILEHTDNTSMFMGALLELVKPTGHIVFESPDCSQLFENYDYTGLWEEHNLYFTPETFQNSFVLNGFSIVRFENHLYPYENCMVCIVKNQLEGGRQSLFSKNILKKENNRIKAYAEGFKKRRDKVKKLLSKFTQNGGKIAIYGAGHLACMFINVMDLRDYIEFVVDDHPNKQGLYMPGSKLPIYSSDALIKKNIKLCLTSFLSETEKKVIQKNKAFLDRGGIFASIFPQSIYALHN